VVHILRSGYFVDTKVMYLGFNVILYRSFHFTGEILGENEHGIIYNRENIIRDTLDRFRENKLIEIRYVFKVIT
jgi:hypothetical protein